MMSIAQTTTIRSARPAREPSLQEHYKTLNRHLQAALLHARRDVRREQEPCGGDSAMD